MHAQIRKQGHACPLGETGVPMADRHHLDAAVRLQRLHHGPERIDVRHHGPVRAAALPLQRGPDGATPGHFERHVELVQFVCDQMDDAIGVAARTRSMQQSE